MPCSYSYNAVRRVRIREALFVSAVTLAHTKLMYVWKVIFRPSLKVSLTETISLTGRKLLGFHNVSKHILLSISLCGFTYYSREPKLLFSNMVLLSDEAEEQNF